MTGIPVRVEPTTYTVSILPDDNVNASHYRIEVVWRAPGSWAVLHGGWCLGVDGAWEYEMQPSSRTSDWLARHRFDFETALRMAREAAPDVECNTITARQVYERQAQP